MRSTRITLAGALLLAGVARAESPADVPHVRSLQGVEDTQRKARVQTRLRGTVTAVGTEAVEIRAGDDRLRVRPGAETMHLRPGDRVTVDVVVVADTPPPGSPHGGPAPPREDAPERQVHRPDGDEDRVRPEDVGPLHPGR